MNENIKIETSVILPVYNVEKYIGKCLESLSNQTYKNFEMIFVIDGSNDKSENIVRHWERTDSRIKIIVQENAGSGPARNNGLKYAVGKYIMFVDPDDWLEPNMLEHLIFSAKRYNVDMVTSGCYSDYYEGERLVNSDRDHFDFQLITNIDDVHRAYLPLYLEGAMGAPTKKVYKKAIIDSAKVCFPDLRRSQDIVFNYRYYQNISSILIDDATLYHYRIEQKVYATKLHPQYYKAISMIYGDINRMLTSWNAVLDEETNKKFQQHFFNLVVWQISLGQSAEEMKNIVHDKNIQKLSREVMPTDRKQQILRRLILLKMNKVINLAVKISNGVKKQ